MTEKLPRDMTENELRYHCAALGAEIERLTAENEKLRAALIEIGLTRDAQKARLIASRAFGDNQQSTVKEG